MPLIDIHAHAMPMPLLRWLSDRGLADLGGVDPDAESGVLRLDPRVSGVAAGVPLPLPRSQWDVSARLAQMDAQGVSHHAVSLPPFLFCSAAADSGLVLDVVRRGNDELGALVAAAPDRLVALGTAPVGLSDGVDEARRCLDAGMAGIAIGTRGGGTELDDSVNEPLWQLLDDRQVFTFLHPSGIPETGRLREFYLPQLLGYPIETAIAVARLVFSGVRERFHFPLCLAHGGGCLPSVRGRLDLGWERKDVARVVPERPSTYLDEIYVDTAVFANGTLRHLVEDLGVDRLLVGTDFPFDLSDRDPVATVDSLALAAPQRAAVEWTTAARLLRLTLEVPQ